MPVNVKLGRLPAVADDRIPLLRAAALPPPPPSANFYAAVGEWGALGNFSVGDCVEAAIGHATLAATTYAGDEKVPTDADALALYSDITGYDPANPATDQGTIILGPGGAVNFWAKNGVVFGGVRSFAKGFAQVSIADGPELLQQAVHYFGGALLGINLPESIVAGDVIPYAWKDPSGPIAGGHAVWLCGYETMPNGRVWVDAVSWGTHVRLSWRFLEGTFQEAVAVYDPDVLNARGVDAQGFDAAELVAAMAALRG